jgi:hypothetical protein
MPFPHSDRMFLDPELTRFIEHVRRESPNAFELAEDLNVFANSWIFTAAPSRSDIRHLLVGALLPRLLTGFQGVVLMAERGMDSECRLMARKVLEVCFRIVAIAASEENALTYVRSDETNRRKLLNKIKALKTVSHTSEQAVLIVSLHAEVTTAIANQNIHEIGTQWFAERAGLMDFYNTAYALLSESAHANVRDLEPVLATTAEGEIEAIEYGPSTTHIESLLLTAVETTVIALDATFILLGSGDRDALGQLRSRHEEVFRSACGAA